MSTQTLAIGTRVVTPDIWSMIQAIAPSVHQSRLFGVSSIEQAAMIALKGYELGMGITASFELIQTIQGRPTLSPRGALALIHQSGALAGMQITEKPGACTVRMQRVNGAEYELTWTIDDAKKTGLIKAGSAWEHYPANMLRWRCIGFVADVVFPDIQGGLKRADEFGAAVDDTGNVTDAEWSTPSTVTTMPASPPVIVPQAEEQTEEQLPVVDTIHVWTLEKLIDKYGADAVFQAADSSVPSTVEEVQETAKKLQEQSDEVPF